MTQTPDISIIGLLACSALLVIPIAVSIIFRLGLVRVTAIAVVRMILQLILIGIFLKYLFSWNNGIINVAWLVIMVGTATFNVTNKIKLKFKVFIIPTFIAFLASTFLVLFYITIFVLPLASSVDARFFVVIGGMLLGNSLRGDIIGVDNFYNLLRRNTQRYHYRLAVGATVLEALFPYLQDSLRSALQPTIATMATMGIVFLPGMMTGQILGGLSPLLAIKYQIVIMIAIFTSTALAILLTILLTMRTCFSKYGVLRQDIFAT